MRNFDQKIQTVTEILQFHQTYKKNHFAHVLRFRSILHTRKLIYAKNKVANLNTGEHVQN